MCFGKFWFELNGLLKVFQSHLRSTAEGWWKIVIAHTAADITDGRFRIQFDGLIYGIDRTATVLEGREHVAGNDLAAECSQYSVMLCYPGVESDSLLGSFDAGLACCAGAVPVLQFGRDFGQK